MAGTATMAVGLFLLSTMDATTSQTTVSLFMVVLGLGSGMVMQVLVLAVQNDVAAADLGVATSAASFFRSLGGSIGAAAFGAIMSARLSSGLAGLAAGDTMAGAGPAMLEASPAAIAALPADVQQAVADVFAQAISTVFLVAVPVAVVALVLVSLLEEKPLRETVHVAGGGPAEDLTLTFEEIEPDHVMTPPPATALGRVNTRSPSRADWTKRDLRRVVRRPCVVRGRVVSGCPAVPANVPSSAFPRSSRTP